MLLGSHQDGHVLDLIIKVIRARQGMQEELTEEQLEELGRRLVKGDVNQAQAEILLSKQAEQGDLQAVNSTLEYMAALGMDGQRTLEIASRFYLAHRHYAEAQRHAETLCYEYQRYGPALRMLAMLDVLQGDYVSALVHIEEYNEYNRRDAELLWYQLDALMRSGAINAAAELNREVGLRPELEFFIQNRVSGKSFRKFSWHGRPTRKGAMFEGFDIPRAQRFFADMQRRPLQREVEDLPMLDLLINIGTYVPDQRQFGHPEVWVHPAAFELTMTGDCEDFALWAWVNLCRLGYPARFMIGGLYTEDLNHAWVSIHRRGTVQVLECTPQGFNPLILAQHAVEYRPWWSVDRNLHFYQHSLKGF